MSGERSQRLAKGHDHQQTGWGRQRDVTGIAARPAVFLDRDGTINGEVEYLSDAAQLRLIPGAAEAIRLLNEAGIPVFVFTNQAAIGRGALSEARLNQIHVELAQLLAREQAHLDGVYWCPHVPEDNCDCRKPNPGLLVRAAAEHQLDLARSFVVGDKASDLEAGQRAGSRLVLVLTGYGQLARRQLEAGGLRPDHVAVDLLAAARWMLANAA